MECEALVLKLFVLVLLADDVTSSQSSCQDVDHDGCIAMSKQNPHMCQDATLAHAVCPKLCNNCPLTCYSCHTNSVDVTSCNTITCSKNQKCMTKSTSDTGPFYLGCADDAICHSGSHATSGSTNCCHSDLCNIPIIPTTPMVTTQAMPIDWSHCPTDSVDLIVVWRLMLVCLYIHVDVQQTPDR